MLSIHSLVQRESTDDCNKAPCWKWQMGWQTPNPWQTTSGSLCKSEPAHLAASLSDSRNAVGKKKYGQKKGTDIVSLAELKQCWKKWALSVTMGALTVIVSPQGLEYVDLECKQTKKVLVHVGLSLRSSAWRTSLFFLFWQGVKWFHCFYTLKVLYKTKWIFTSVLTWGGEQKAENTAFWWVEGGS